MRLSRRSRVAIHAIASLTNYNNVYAGDETLQDSGYESLPVGEESTADRAARCKSLARTRRLLFLCAWL
jgi:hypothetical protein